MSTIPQAWSGMEEPVRKKMRKGTKSCIECRRRKMRCTWEDGRSACNECSDRDSTCISQEQSVLPVTAKPHRKDQTSSTKERMRKLENNLKKLTEQLESGAPTKTSIAIESAPKPRQPADVPLFELEAHQNESMPSAPALTLFNNAVITRQEVSQPSRRQKHHIERDYRLTEALRSLLPNDQTLRALVSSSDAWWRIWRRMFPDILGSKHARLVDYVYEELSAKSTTPTRMAKVVMCLATCLNQLSPDCDVKSMNLGASPEELMEEYVSAVSRLVTCDDDVVGTLDGVECMFMESKHYADVGRPRKCWLLLKRTIPFAQLLGLHRIDIESFTPSGLFDQRQHSIWQALYQSDRLMSMILGFPHSIPDAIAAPTRPTSLVQSPYPNGMFHILTVLSLVGRVIERNQNPGNMSFSETMRLEQELEDSKDTIPAQFWDLRQLEDEDVDLWHQRLLSCLIHHQIRVFLHMPFMLKSTTNQRYQYSRQAAVESSRDLILCYTALRSSTAGRYVCKLLDFQAFGSAVLILLNLCGYGSGSLEKDTTQESRDWDTIDLVIETLHEASKEAGGIIAAQSAKALETLAAVRHGCAGFELQDPEQVGKIVVPYFGTITTRPGKHFVVPVSAAATASSNGCEIQCPAQLTPALTPDRQSDPSGCSSTTTFTHANSTATTSMADFTLDPYISFESSMGGGVGGGGGERQAYTTGGAWPNNDPQFGSGQAISQIGAELDDTWDWVGFFNQNTGPFQ